MSKLPVKNARGESQGDYELNDDLLVYDRGAQSVHDAVVAQRANRRAGTASTLAKAEVSGTRAKPWRQKGTGRARAGYKQSPIWRGGAVAFGPKPRSYAKKQTKKEARLAFRRAFSDKVASDQLLVVEELGITEPKTKLFVDLLNHLEVSAPALVLVEEGTREELLAVRNIPGVEVLQAKDVSTYELLRAHQVVATRAAMTVLEARLAASVRRGA